MTSIIIPAYNEASVIKRGLTALLNEIGADDEVIVVCNGCHDNTADVARRVSDVIRVEVIEESSKTAALNHGDAIASTFPRIYMDADTWLKSGSIEKIKSTLLNTQCDAVSPEVEMCLKNSSWVVGAYYDIWLNLPYCQSGLIGAGVYALSEAGRGRFKQFPNIIADDGYVRSLFNDSERSIAKGAVSVVQAPSSLKWLLKIKIRSRKGGIELSRSHLTLKHSNSKTDYFSVFVSLLKGRYHWGKFAVYFMINVIARILANRELKDRSKNAWEQDLSSRKG